MPPSGKILQQGLARIYDANVNRAREGLRVGEEIARLMLEDRALQRRFKRARHGITEAENHWPGLPPLTGRAASQDPGARALPHLGNHRSGLTDLARANLRRSQEALRVLEEFSKLQAPQNSLQWKALRFHVYGLEQALVFALARRFGGSKKNQA